MECVVHTVKKDAGETDHYLLNNHLQNGLPDMFHMFVTGDLGILKPNHSG